MNDPLLYSVKYQTRRKRLWASIVDAIVFMPFLLIGSRIYGWTQNNTILIAWLLFTTFSPIAYNIILNYKYGQTIGKWVAGVKIVDVSEVKNISLRQAVIRISFLLGIMLTGLFYYSYQAIRTGETEYLFNDYYTVFGNIPAFTLFLVEFVCLMTNPKRRAMHDFIAGSTVIRFDPPPPTPPTPTSSKYSN
jgi:uncharacterized RDD family membrane protein YckC